MELDVDTGSCNFLTLTQPTVLGLRAGQSVEVVAWHLDLFSEVPATAHAAVLLGDQIIWEKLVDIPSTPKLFADVVTVDFDAPLGTPIWFHLHNHGSNEWRLLRIHVVETGSESTGLPGP